MLRRAVGSALHLDHYLCLIYISESSQSHVVDSLRKKLQVDVCPYDSLSTAMSRITPVQQNLSTDSRPRLIHSFRDDAYNRTSFYLLQKVKDPVDSFLLDLLKTAFSL